ncbi:MAG: ThuA domain-containing protein [Deinococcales bacterium]
MINITIWNENIHERENALVKGIYPQGIHGAIEQGIRPLGNFNIKTATLEMPDHGLSEELLNQTDVLVWWGHRAHDKVSDSTVEMVYRHVLNGMGLIVLHSGHFSKIFKRLMGTHCSLKWREADEKERLWNLEPGHPIMEGIPDYFEIPAEEMYGERFDIPEPDKLLMISWFQGGEVFRSACLWQRGHGQVFYFRPGHETFPTYHNATVLRIIANACDFIRRRINMDSSHAPNSKELEPVPNPSKEHIL